MLRPEGKFCDERFDSKALRGGLCVVFLGGFNHALAKPFNYQEQFDGDLPASSALTHFILDNGQNLVAGSDGFVTAMPTPQQPPFDFDPFTFTIAVGKSMLGGSLSVLNSVGRTNGESWLPTRDVAADGSGGTDVQTFVLAAPDAVALPALGPGTYGFREVQFGGSTTIPALLDYAFTFDVVPEPAGLSALAVAAIAVGRRRRR